MQQKLSIKSLISIGLFNAVAIVIYLLVGIATLPVPILHIFAVPCIAALINGSVILLLATKVSARGVFLISGMIHAIIFSLMMGLYGMLIICPIAGFIADRIAGTFNSKIKIILAYIVFSIGLYIGQSLFFILLTDWFLSLFSGSMATHKQQAAENLTNTAIALTSIAVGVCSAAGGFFGTILLKKHFIKAGVTT